MNPCERMLQVYAHYARHGRSLATAALAGADAFKVWTHHPLNDALDHQHGTRFYYHAHEAEDPVFAGEHGHFHVFAPLDNPQSRAFVHLAGISLDPKGTALGLFTTNGWVTGEGLAPLRRIERALSRFQLQLQGRMAPVARWIEALVHWQRPAIAELLRERDRRLRQHPQGLQAAWQDTQRHVTSRLALPNFWPSLIKEST